MLDKMKKEFCTRCNTKTGVKATRRHQVVTDPDGKREVIRTSLFHCEICKSFVRRKKYNSGRLLKTGDTFTPRARNIWRAIPGDTQFKILNTVWCTCCRGMSGINNITARVDSGLLVLMGQCRRCGGDVARVVINE